MSSQQIQVRQDPTLALYAGQEERTPHEWEEQFVDTWLLLEVTAEDEAGEPVCARLIATTTDPMTDAFQQLWRAYADRSVLTLFTHSKYSAPHPYVVAHATCVGVFSSSLSSYYHSPPGATYWPLRRPVPSQRV